MSRSLQAVSMFAMLCAAPGLLAQGLLSAGGSEMHATNDLSSNGAIAALASPVKGEPYEASKVTRSVWKLADGTTIKHESESKIARDGDGRVREDMENTEASSFGGKQINRTTEAVTIADPVDHSLTTWTGTTKTAIRMQMPDLSALSKRPGLPGGITGGVRLGAPSIGSAGPPIAVRHSQDSLKMPVDADDARTEDLGKQSLAGLLATGKRTTTVIATGKIGNDQPITIVHEEWYSPDLKLVVKSMDSDPRSGERTMELQGMTRGDPDAALFHAPEGYTVKDMGNALKSLGDLGKPAAK